MRIMLLLFAVATLSSYRSARADDDPDLVEPVALNADACLHVKRCKQDDEYWQQARLGRFAWQPLVDASVNGYTNTHDAPATGRIDAILRFGVRFFNGPSIPRSTAIVSGVALLAGGGVAYATDGRLRWRADATVSRSWQGVARTESQLFANLPISLDLSVAFLGGVGEASNMIEGQATFGAHGAGWGFFLRGGYNLGGPMQPTGGTIGFGYEATALTFARFTGGSLLAGTIALVGSLALSGTAAWLVAHNSTCPDHNC